MAGALALASSGCGQAAGGSSQRRSLLARPPSPQQDVLTALSDADPLERRAALARVARSRESRSSWAVEAYSAIALLEADPHLRCLALRALAGSGDPRACSTLVRVLQAPGADGAVQTARPTPRIALRGAVPAGTDGAGHDAGARDADSPPQESVRPVPDLCRVAAAGALADLLESGTVPDEQRAAAEALLIRCLREDADWRVRLAAARGLGRCPSPSSVQALIDALNDANFAVVHRCEESLARLTGVVHGCDPTAWRRWYDEHRDDPFAGAGQVPPQRRPPYRNAWEKAAYEARQLWRTILAEGLPQ